MERLAEKATASSLHSLTLYFIFYSDYIKLWSSRVPFELFDHLISVKPHTESYADRRRELMSKPGSCGGLICFQCIVSGRCWLCYRPAAAALTVMLQWMISGFSPVTLNWQLSSSGFHSMILNRSWFGWKIDTRNFSSAFSPDTDIFSSSQKAPAGRCSQRGSRGGVRARGGVGARIWHVSVRTKTKRLELWRRERGQRQGQRQSGTSLYLYSLFNKWMLAYFLHPFLYCTFAPFYRLCPLF